MVEHEGKQAYVALLHGQSQEFLLYALLLGYQLNCLDNSTPRVLLVGLALPDYPAPFLEADFKRCLEIFWQVSPVDLIAAAKADKSWRKRHQYVFTKLRALEIPYKKLLFFDLDVFIREDPSSLFGVLAPAGMYHGDWMHRNNSIHGELIGRPALDSGCVNAGLLRLDTLDTHTARSQLLKEMIEEVASLTEKDASYLPEQYYLVRKLSAWRHLHVSWNCEVSPEVYVECEFRGESSIVVGVQHPSDWWQLDLANVRMFHFSGTQLQPWWYLHLDVADAKAIVRSQFSARDSRGMVALAVSEWLQEIKNLLESLETAGAVTELQAVVDLISKLKLRTSDFWKSTETCSHCGATNKDQSHWEECVVSSDARKRPKLSELTEDTESASMRTKKLLSFGGCP